MSEKKNNTLKIFDYEKGDTIRVIPLGVIKLAKNKRTNETIVLTILKKCKIIKYGVSPHILNELKILPILEHPSIVSFLGSAHDEKYIYFGFEFIPGGDLFNSLKVDTKFSLEKVQFYSGQIIFVLDYLHSKKIIYRNLKPENILINKNGYIKLIDFGLSKIIEDRTFTMCGTPGYLAPEIILNKGYGLSIDWWALGVLLYEMICGVEPFYDDEPMKIYDNILERKLLFSSDFDSQSKSLIKHLLEPDLSKRYGNLKNGVNDIKNHLFFKNMNWNKLMNQEIEAPFIPNIKDNELKYYSVYPDSEDNVEEYNNDNDPFKDWFK